MEGVEEDCMGSQEEEEEGEEKEKKKKKEKEAVGGGGEVTAIANTFGQMKRQDIALNFNNTS